MKYLITIFFAGVVVLCSCNGESPSEPGKSSPYEIQGTIVDTDGNLLTDVKLYLIYKLSDIPDESPIKNSHLDSVAYLNQNFPNPFIDGTNLSFNIPARGFVKLFITPFNSSDTLKFIINSIIDEGFYALFLDEEFVNNLYSCNLWVKISADSIFQDEIFMLKNNDDPDSLLTEGNPNYEIFNSSFNINYASIPFENVVQFTESSPNVTASKIITRDLTFVFTKTGYKNLVETHPINSNASTKIIFRMERE